MTEIELMCRTTSVSKDLVCNKNGVLWRDIVRENKAASDRCLAAHRAAILAWRKYYELKQANEQCRKAKQPGVGRKEVRDAADLAIELTRIALD